MANLGLANFSCLRPLSELGSRQAAYRSIFRPLFLVL